MSKNSTSLHKQFLKKTKAINKVRDNFENAFTSSAISSTDITQAYAGLYLDLFTEFETLLESLFFGLLKSEIKANNQSVLRKIKINPISETENVLHYGKAYLDWLPYTDHTLPRAKLYFHDGKPFSFLTDIQKGQLKNYHKIRNAIAHKSKKALKEFNQVIDGLTLFSHEKTPQGYLRNIPNRSTGKTQLEIISDELTAIAYSLCS